MSGSWRCCCFYPPFSPLLYTLAFLGGFSSAHFIFFFLSIKTFFHCQQSKPSCPVRQSAGDLLAVSCETVLNVAKDSLLHFPDAGEEKVCRMLLCRPQCGCLKRLFLVFLASLAKLVLLEVTFRIKLQYKQKKSNKRRVEDRKSA